MNIYQFRVQLKSDTGPYILITSATSYAACSKLIQDTQNCPERSIQSISIVKVLGE